MVTGLTHMTCIVLSIHLTQDRPAANCGAYNMNNTSHLSLLNKPPVFISPMA